MKTGVLCMWLCFAGIVFMLFNGSISEVNGSILVSDEMTADGNSLTRSVTSRELKENTAGSSLGEERRDGAVSLEDYRPYDPSPSSKASIRPGPIQHGAPIMPYIPNPKPSPPPKRSDDDEFDP